MPRPPRTQIQTRRTLTYCRPKMVLTTGATLDLGLESLDLAELVALLELRFGFDPFSHHAAITDVHTVQDLCNAYLRAGADQRPKAMSS
jgi:acyl carrier protein